MKKILLSIFIGLIFVVVFAWKVLAVNYPNYSNYINDFADILTSQQEEQLNLKIYNYDKQTTNQIAVAIIRSLEGDTIENYSIHLADLWKPGQKEKDNGVLMLFAMDDRKIRIEVGMGLEGDLTDLESKKIIDNTISPEFKQQKYFEGIDKGIDATINAIATTSAEIKNETNSDGTIVIVILVAGIFIFILMLACSPLTPLGGEGTWGITSIWSSSSDSSDSGGSSNGFGGFGGGSFSGGGASGGF